MMCWGPMTQLLCGSHLYLCVRSECLSVTIGAIGAAIGRYRSYRTGLDSARACHRRETCYRVLSRAIGAIGAIGVLSECYRRSTIELSDHPSGRDARVPSDANVTLQLATACAGSAVGCRSCGKNHADLVASLVNGVESLTGSGRGSG